MANNEMAQSVNGKISATVGNERWANMKTKMYERINIYRTLQLLSSFPYRYVYVSDQAFIRKQRSGNQRSGSAKYDTFHVFESLRHCEILIVRIRDY